MLDLGAVEIVFFLTLAITFFAAYLGRIHSRAKREKLANESLNKWLVGLSAGATANSGFIVTGAVGLGYSFGPQWLFLPISWFLGDLVFWKFFPHKINKVGREVSASTMSELLKAGLTGSAAKIAYILVALIVLVCLGAYTSAQWIAGQKFISGAFALPSHVSLLLFALLVIAYTSIGGFRGSIYADATQAVIRIIGTLVALIAIVWMVQSDTDTFFTNINQTDESFSNWLPGNSLTMALFFILGFAFASFGFGLGQPQIISRYLAASSPEETRSAQWIYIGFVQFTWLSMTLFGVLLRGIMPDIPDPEVGLSLFFNTFFGPIVTGIIVADVFATIAATSNSLLITMSQAVIHNFLPAKLTATSVRHWTFVVVCLLGGLSMISATYLAQESSVFELAIGAISLMGAGLAAPVMVKVLHWHRTGLSLLMSIISGLTVALIWKYLAYDQVINEAMIGILTGLTVNFLVARKSIQDQLMNTDDSLKYKPQETETSHKSEKL